MDFLTRFKGRTQTMNKEGISGIIKSSGNPIEKLHAFQSCSQLLATTASHTISDTEKQSPYSNDFTPKSKDPKIITNISSFHHRKSSLASPPTPNSNLNMSKSQIDLNNNQMQTLSKTGSTNFNLNDYQLIIIPKEALCQYKMENTEYHFQNKEPLQQIQQRYYCSKSQSVDQQKVNPLIKSQILSQGSYSKQNERKKSMIQAGLNTIQY
ncbi:unnamed protein product (macronuclear) [Paramecium tetraurelia]|uniref:Uncharacterized protein n=1 Tax=Paramecium tetraurelia TaxID=5888 RepID=A0E3Q1_PARTE|nr:uncharacterized protein GSPATT00023091001 [Paramecium tetraurelia]CAK89918.1 unnamed protein product [Paramecium tetraurelia]|eukprot:XP_001457315.1 hypothetical protein (macronuclear) [Paramecium tetraurelia strain d4-2]